MHALSKPYSLAAALLLGAASGAAAQQSAPGGTARVAVQVDGAPIGGALVSAGARSARTAADGIAVLALPPGPAQLAISRLGFRPDTLRFAMRAGLDTTIVASLEPAAESAEPIVVTSTRLARRIESEPLRVEVLGGDDVSEKNEMRPGDLSSLLDELSGVRMRRTSASLGATNVRLQGLPGRYTLVLEDGLPLFGTQASGFSMVEQPPLDLKQAEVIKGAASSLYGPAALGGVVDLVSRRPPDTSQVLVNGTSQGGADLLVFDARQLSPTTGITLLGGAHRASATDPDRDGWSDQPGLRRGELRPRLFYSDRAGRTLMVSAGVLDEARAGGALPGRTAFAAPIGLDSLSTQHGDVGVSASAPIARNVTVSLRASANVQSRRRIVSGALEREHEGATFGELSATADAGAQTFIGGVAWQQDRYVNRDQPWANGVETAPGVFVQHSYAPARWIASTLDGRCDASNEYGTICTPRASLLLRPVLGLSVRASAGAGWSAPSALSDLTEAIGLSHVREPHALEAERAQSASLDVTASRGPLQVSGTLFGNVVRHPVGLRPVAGDTTGLVQLVNAPGDLHLHGGELFAVYNQEPFVVTAYYAATRSRERSLSTVAVREAPYVPREEAGLDAAIEDDESGAYLAAEVFYTGRQSLQDDPYRGVSAPYTTLGLLAAKRVGRATLFVNAENLTGVRQTAFEPLMRARPGDGGSWTVDAWGPLEGRRFNAGVRYHF
ncbi:MAG TPA: TonB-dependent receptor [Gemmatimonadaceae bacterium]|nr:TonB-dependent receptor [Gemmatimonadaceae bacterium]